MKRALKFGLVGFAGAALLLACAAPGWGQRGGHAGGSMGARGGGMSGARVSGGMSRGPMTGGAARMAPRMAPSRMSSMPAASRPIASRPVAARSRTSAVARPGRVSSVSANRRTVTTFRTRRDRFGHLHRVRVVSFVGVGYPGYLGYYPYDYGFDQGSYDNNQNAYDAAPQQAPAVADDSAPAAGSYAAAAPDATVPDAGQLILVRADGQILTPNAFTISGDRLVYVTREGARLSFPVAELDKDTTRKMNAANGTNVVIPD